MWSSDITKAFDYAMYNHRTQTRKAMGSVPYGSHLMAVTAIVLECGGTEAEAIAALLHDVVEDTDRTLNDIQVLFGDEVMSIVAQVSEDKSLKWEDRKRAAITHVTDMTDSGLLVKCADVLHNTGTLLSDFDSINWSFFKKGKHVTLHKYSSVLKALVNEVAQRQNFAPVIRERLDKTYANFQELVLTHCCESDPRKVYDWFKGEE